MFILSMKLYVNLDIIHIERYDELINLSVLLYHKISFFIISLLYLLYLFWISNFILEFSNS